MNLNANPLDWFNLHPAIHPVDLAGGANDGIWVSLKGYAGCLVILQKDAGTPGQDPILTLMQATDVSGTGAKALNFPTVRSKLHATTVPGLFTEVANPTGDNSYVDDTSAEQAGIIAIDIKPEYLDVDNGFDCLRITIADTGVTVGDIGAGLYLLYGAKYGGFDKMLSPIAN